MNFFSLLYVDVQQRENINIDAKLEEQMDVYIKCGINLSNSLKFFGSKFSILTNNANFINSRISHFGGSVDVVELHFDRDVPTDARFFSAHFKLDILRAFGDGQFGEDMMALIDIDMVMLRPLPVGLDKLQENVVLVYDITSSVTSELRPDVVARDLQSVGARMDEVVWYGGEFIAGRKEAFKTLANEVAAIWPRYVATYSQLHHVGDEMVVTAALINLKNGPLSLVDIGCSPADLAAPDAPRAIPFVTRWWTARTGYRQVSFTKAAEAVFLHLPSDKPFLANFSNEEFSPKKFNNFYQKYARKKLFFRRILNPAICLAKRRFKYVAKI